MTTTKELRSPTDIKAPPKMVHLEGVPGSLVALCGKKCTTSRPDRPGVDCVVCGDLESK